MAEKKKKINKQLLNIAFLAVLIAITLIVIFTATDIKFGDIFVFLRDCDPWWIVGALGLTVASVIFEAISLHFIMRGLGERPTFYQSTVYTSADLYYSAITPSGTGGQPAAIYYMVKDGIGAGRSTFGFILNLTAYTLSIIIIGAVGFAVRPAFFSAIGDWFPKTLIVVGCIIQALLLAFFIGCMFWGGAVKKAGNGIISLLVRMHIVKKPDKWRKKLQDEVDLYKGCIVEIKNHPAMSLINLLSNLGQRFCHVLIPVFVILAAMPDADVVALTVCSSLIIIGYNSIPLPGGMGVYEYLYVAVYRAAGLGAGESFILSALMVSRFISFYLIMIGCGIYTLIYHVQVMRRPSKEPAEETEETEPPAETNGEGEQEGPLPEETLPEETLSEEIRPKEAEDSETDKISPEKTNL